MTDSTNLSSPPLSCGNCGQVKNNDIEPRFGYVYCEDCANVPPVRFGSTKQTIPFGKVIDTSSGEHK